MRNLKLRWNIRRLLPDMAPDDGKGVLSFSCGIVLVRQSMSLPPFNFSSKSQIWKERTSVLLFYRPWNNQNSDWANCSLCHWYLLEWLPSTEYPPRVSPTLIFYLDLLVLSLPNHGPYPFIATPNLTVCCLASPCYLYPCLLPSYIPPRGKPTIDFLRWEGSFHPKGFPSVRRKFSPQRITFCEKEVFAPKDFLL